VPIVLGTSTTLVNAVMAEIRAFFLLFICGDSFPFTGVRFVGTRELRSISKQSKTQLLQFPAWGGPAATNSVLGGNIIRNESRCCDAEDTQKIRSCRQLLCSDLMSTRFVRRDCSTSVKSGIRARGNPNRNATFTRSSWTTHRVSGVLGGELLRGLGDQGLPTRCRFRELRLLPLTAFDGRHSEDVAPADGWPRADE
jgi:hypothetical protein